MGLAAAIQQLHDRCAIYTSATAASRLLDMVGWTPNVDLSRSTLLEPCVGEGAILLEGVRRLMGSLRAGGLALNVATLTPRIVGFELHPGAAGAAKHNLRRLLVDQNVNRDLATKLVEAWVVTRDFLLEMPRRATHVAANPPYVRWGKLPPLLASEYRKVLPAAATRGDVSVAFLHRMQEWADDGGLIAALVSDRWMFAQYGEQFVESTKKRGWSIRVADERPTDPFMQEVGAYSAMVVLAHENEEASTGVARGRERARQLHRDLVVRHGTIADAGCEIRVGPALGAGRTFILQPEQSVDVESELVRSFVGREALGVATVTTTRMRVVVPYDNEGKLIDPCDWPRFARWAALHEEALRKRSHFKGSDKYWRTIDAVSAVWSQRPKLLIPELCNEPVVTLDRTGSIPAHSLYAIWPGEWPIAVLQRVLNGGLLELTARAETPMLRHGWMRFYKRFLMRTPLPKWSELSPSDRVALEGKSDVQFGQVFARLFGFSYGALSIS